MGKTIIQTIGPLYGEVVNGTVFGRPNGSIFIPLSNKISLSTSAVGLLKQSNGVIRTCTGTGVLVNNNLVAESQDTASYMQYQLSADGETWTATASLSAGLFNIQWASVSSSGSSFTITAGETYYLRGVLVASTGVPVAVSETLELTGVEL